MKTHLPAAMLILLLVAATTAHAQRQLLSFRAPASRYNWDPSLVGTGPPPVNDLVVGPIDAYWDANPADGFSMTIDIYLEAGPNGMKAAGIFMSSDSRITYDGATDWFAAGWAIEEYGDAAAPPYGAPMNTQGWSTSPADAEQWQGGTLDADRLRVPPDLDGGLRNEVGTIATDLVSGAADGFFASITLNIPAVGEAYPITILTGGYMGDLDGNAYTNIDFGTITVASIIPPEPSSALLLMGALPLLRRNRRGHS